MKNKVRCSMSVCIYSENKVSCITRQFYEHGPQVGCSRVKALWRQLGSRKDVGGTEEGGHLGEVTAQGAAGYAVCIRIPSLLAPLTHSARAARGLNRVLGLESYQASLFILRFLARIYIVFRTTVECKTNYNMIMAKWPILVVLSKKERKENGTGCCLRVKSQVKRVSCSLLPARRSTGQA